jgi:hypothetical protein
VPFWDLFHRQRIKAKVGIPAGHWPGELKHVLIFDVPIAITDEQRAIRESIPGTGVPTSGLILTRE